MVRSRRAVPVLRKPNDGMRDRAEGPKQRAIVREGLALLTLCIRAAVRHFPVDINVDDGVDALC